VESITYMDIGSLTERAELCIRRPKAIPSMRRIMRLLILQHRLERFE